MVETDCPYLAPVPFRGKRCEPAHTRLVAESIAAARGHQRRRNGRATTETAEKVFSIHPMRSSRPTRFLFAAAALGLTSCVAPDTRHHVIISVPQQRMALLDNGALLATYPVSTSKFALGDSPGSLGTPLGELEIAEKIGGAAPSGAVFKDRRRTGEILPPDAPGRDPIVTRILWLRGREAAERECVRPLHLHSRHTRGANHRPAGELRLRADAFSRRDPALRHRRSRREGHDCK